MFRELDAEEEVKFRKWARDNYKPFTVISDIYHPVVQDECAKINKEESEKGAAAILSAWMKQ